MIGIETVLTAMIRIKNEIEKNKQILKKEK